MMEKPTYLSNETVQKEIIRAIDFSSMELANQNHKNNLARNAYYKTKKDVVEFKRVKPIDALNDKDVIQFVSEYSNEVWHEFQGNLNDLKDYLSFCQEFLKSVEIETLMCEKSQLISEAETRMALKQKSEAKELYLKAAIMELQLAEKSPKHRFIQLVSGFWCAFKAEDFELAAKICEMVGKITGLNEVQEEEVNNIKKEIGW